MISNGDLEKALGRLHAGQGVRSEKRELGVCSQIRTCKKGYDGTVHIICYKCSG